MMMMIASCSQKSTVINNSYCDFYQTVFFTKDATVMKVREQIRNIRSLLANNETAKALCDSSQ